MSGDDMELQQVDYVRVLAKYDARDVEAACLHWAETSQWWPTLNDLVTVTRDCKFNREARARAAAENRKLADVTGATDYWSLHYTALGVGLQVLQGQILLDGLEAREAADWFNEALERIGLEHAKTIANDAYKAGFHAAILPAIMRVSGLEAPKGGLRGPANVARDNLEETLAWYRKHNPEYGCKLLETYDALEARLATGDRTGLIPDMRERAAA